ncbi:MAG: hypothetical protein ACLR3U_02950 [Christensenellaceae bacterium]|jgi:hypothetical protein
MGSNELKRELSKLSGVDFFNPKYRELFKKAFPEDKDAEEEKLKKEGMIGEEKIKDKTEDIDKAEDEREIDKIERDKAETPEKRDEKAEEVREETHEIGKEVDELKGDKTEDMLLETKIENALLRGGVREEKLGPAMRLAKSEIGGLDELGKVEDILKDFPEWVHGYKPKGFGMDIDNGSDNLSEEEKRLKQMGINPRD